MSKPRVLIWLSDLGGGGAQRTLLNLAAALPSHGLAVELAVGDAQGPAQAWLDSKLPYNQLATRRLAAALPALTRLLRSSAPDAVLSTMVDANVVAFWANRFAGNRAALILRETNSHRARGDIGLLRRRLVRMAYRSADQVIALSQGVRTELVADMGLDQRRVVTIPNPVEVSNITQLAECARNLPAPAALAAGFRHLVAVGRLHWQKGFDILIEALSRQDGSVRLVILGEGPERAALEAQISRLGLSGRVHMPGFVDDVTAYLAHADLFVLSSRWEGFGHVIVEAMAAAVPVVATNCPYGPADILQHDQTGWLVPPSDPDALASAITLLLNDRPRAARLAASGAAAAGRYQTMRVAGEYATAIKEAVLRKNSGAARSASVAHSAKV